MASTIAAENKKKLNISDCMADKTEIPKCWVYIFVVKECNGNKANYNMLPNYKICTQKIGLYKFEHFSGKDYIFFSKQN